MDDEWINDTPILLERIESIGSRLQEVASDFETLHQRLDADDIYFREYERRVNQACSQFGHMEHDMTDDELIKVLTAFEDLRDRIQIVQSALGRDSQADVHLHLDALSRELTDALIPMRPLIVRAASSGAGSHLAGLWMDMLQRIDNRREK